MFDTCVFESLGYGVVFGYGSFGVVAQATGPCFNIVTNSVFDNVERHGVWIVNGTKNFSLHNRYANTGNEGGTASSAAYSIVQFDSVNNISDNDKFDRFHDLSYNVGFPASPFVPSVGGYVSKTDGDFFRLEIGQVSTAIELFKLPAASDTAYEIEYVYRSNAVNALRHGTLSISVNYSEGTSRLVDDYNYDGTPAYVNSLVFTSAVVDKDSDSNLDTLVINYTNNITNDNGEILLRVKTLSIV